MKKFIIVFLMIGSIAFTDTVIEWEETYGGEKNDDISCIIKTEDGGFLFCGSISDTDPHDLWITKLYANGQIDWEQSFTGPDDDWAVEALEIDDGYYIAGNTYNPDNVDYWILKIDKSGNILWEDKYGGFNNDWANCACLTDDGGCVIAGETLSFGAGYADAMLVKYDADGNREEPWVYGYELVEGVKCIQKIKEGYIFAGVTIFHGDRDFWVVMLDRDFNVIKELKYKIEGYNYAYSIREFDNKFVAVGTTREPDSTISDIMLLILDRSLNIIGKNEKLGGQGQDIPEVLEVNRDGFVIGGYVGWPGVGKGAYGLTYYDCLLIWTDFEGNFIDDKLFGKTNNDKITSLVVTDDGYALAGIVRPSGQFDNGWVMKMKETNWTLVEEEPEEFIIMDNYPNPFNPTTMITYVIPDEGHVRISVYDVRGAAVDVLVDEVMGAGKHEVVWDASKVASGMYFYRLESDDFTKSGKMLLIK